MHTQNKYKTKDLVKTTNKNLKKRNNYISLSILAIFLHTQMNTLKHTSIETTQTYLLQTPKLSKHTHTKTHNSSVP